MGFLELPPDFWGTDGTTLFARPTVAHICSVSSIMSSSSASSSASSLETWQHCAKPRAHFIATPIISQSCKWGPGKSGTGYHKMVPCYWMGVMRQPAPNGLGLLGSPSVFCDFLARLKASLVPYHGSPAPTVFVMALNSSSKDASVLAMETDLPMTWTEWPLLYRKAVIAELPDVPNDLLPMFLFCIECSIATFVWL